MDKPATIVIETADKSTVISPLIIVCSDSRTTSTDAMAMMDDNTTMAIGSKRLRPKSTILIE